jgi:hypothetical protein
MTRILKGNVRKYTEEGSVQAGEEYRREESTRPLSVASV